MKKIHYKVIITILFTAILLFMTKSVSNAGTAGISASSTDVKEIMLILMLILML